LGPLCSPSLWFGASQTRRPARCNSRDRTFRTHKRILLAPVLSRYQEPLSNVAPEVLSVNVKSFHIGFAQVRQEPIRTNAHPKNRPSPSPKTRDRTLHTQENPSCVGVVKISRASLSEVLSVSESFHIGFAQVRQEPIRTNAHPKNRPSPSPKTSPITSSGHRTTKLKLKPECQRTKSGLAGTAAARANADGSAITLSAS
jgi:hypothetical protein